MQPNAYERKETLLRVENVSLTLGHKLILKNVNAHIENVVRPDLKQGQVVCILGPSGIGKTQLSRLLSGLGQPTSGTVRVNEGAQPVHRGMVGVVPQNYPLFNHRTVLGNLVVAGRQARLSDPAASEQALKYLERFGLADQRTQYPVQLSGGQRQRVAIAQQLMCSEHFLLLDEPFSGLDFRAKLDVCELIAEVALMDELNTIIPTTHDVKTAALISDTIWLMGREHDRQGNLVPGASIVEVFDLAAKGLAWHQREEMETTPAFRDLVHGIEKRFERREL